MIILKVEEYCHSCPDFQAEVRKTDSLITESGELYLGDTIVQCVYKNRCTGLVRFLNNKINKGDIEC